MAGFGGVAEYGITVRWDKNFLKLIRLLLVRRAQFALYGGVRFGGTLDTGACVRARLRPRRAGGGSGPSHRARASERSRGRRAYRFRLPDGAAAHRRGERGVACQHAASLAGRRDRRGPDGDRYGDRVARVLPGASRKVSCALRGPGGRRIRGRTCALRGPPTSRRSPTSSWNTLARFARSVRSPSRERRDPDLVGLLDRLGRRDDRLSPRLIDSPSYTLNHEEVEKALEEGVRFAEGLTPIEVELDESGRADALKRVGPAPRAVTATASAAGAHDSRGRRNATEYDPCARAAGRLRARRQALSPCSTRKAAR